MPLSGTVTHSFDNINVIVTICMFFVCVCVCCKLFTLIVFVSVIPLFV